MRDGSNLFTLGKGRATWVFELHQSTDFRNRCMAEVRATGTTDANTSQSMCNGPVDDWACFAPRYLT